MPWAVVVAAPWVVAAAALLAVAATAAALSEAEDIAAARWVDIVVVTAAMDIAAATVMAAATAMAAGGSDSDLDSVIPTTAAITAIRTPMDIHITAAAIIQIPYYSDPYAYGSGSLQLSAAALRNSSISTDHLRSNSSNMVRNMARRSQSTPRLSAAAASERTAAELRASAEPRAAAAGQQLPARRAVASLWQFQSQLLLSQP